MKLVKAKVQAIFNHGGWMYLNLIPIKDEVPQFLLPVLNSSANDDKQLEIPVAVDENLLSMLPGSIVELSVKPVKKKKTD